MTGANGVSPIAMSTASPNAGTASVVIVAGPTATGKSELAIRIAEAFDGVVINADSMQVYAELDILSARPGPADLARAPHRLYGVLPIAEGCSAGRWRDLARAEIDDARAAGRLPILCGGTGLYLRALIDGIADIPAIPEAVRAAARRRHAALGGAAFRQALATRDPAAAAHLADGDRQRLLRAWEVVEATGRPLSQWRACPAPAGDLRPFAIVLMPARAELYQRCDDRFSAMIAAGALDEARRIMALAPDPGLPGMKALGLPQLMAHLRGRMSLDAAIAAAQRDTRRYAKRQCTWFRRQINPDILHSARVSQAAADGIIQQTGQFLLTAPG